MARKAAMFLTDTRRQVDGAASGKRHSRVRVNVGHYSNAFDDFGDYKDDHLDWTIK